MAIILDGVLSMRCRGELVISKKNGTHTLTSKVGSYTLVSTQHNGGHRFSNSITDSITVTILDDSENKVERTTEFESYAYTELVNHQVRSFAVVKNDQQKVGECINLINKLFELESDSTAEDLFKDRLGMLTYWNYGKEETKQLVKKEERQAKVIPKKKWWRRLFHL